MRSWYQLSSIKIKDIPKNERPIERLILMGAEHLHSEELLAILLKTGTKNGSAKFLGSTLLKEVGDISKLNELNYERLLKIKGIGPSKAASLLAAIELSKRMQMQITTLQKQKLNNTSLVFEYYKAKLADKHQEMFYAVYLDNKKRIIQDTLLFMGSLSYSMVHPREIFRKAILLEASSIICVHNHPSGFTDPSEADKQITEKLVMIGKLFGIYVIDHIIVGKYDYYSFYENGYIQ